MISLTENYKKKLLPEPAAPSISQLYLGKGYIEGGTEMVLFSCIHFKHHSSKRKPVRLHQKFKKKRAGRNWTSLQCILS